MPKTSKRKKTSGRVPAGGMAMQKKSMREAPTVSTRRAAPFMGVPSLQNVVFSAMVALGCWGMAAFCFFFYAVEPNHNLYGGVMAVTALIWSTIAARRWSSYRQRT